MPASLIIICDQLEQEIAAGSTSYQWDAANRLKSVNNGSLGSYGYDGNGKRVRKTESGTTTYYVISSVLGSVLEVTLAGVQRAYVMSGSSVVAQLNPNGQFYWLHLDHLGSGRKMTDTSGNMVYRAEFDPYGKLLYEWSSPSNLNTKKFTGYERDAATNLDYAQARMYSSEWGRFMSPDPMGLKSADLQRPKSLNRYGYVNGDPVNFKDPSGERGFEWGFFLPSACNGYMSAFLTEGFFCGLSFGGFWDDFTKAGPWLGGGGADQQKDKKEPPVTCDIAVVATTVPNTITIGQHTAILTRESGQIQWTVYEAGPTGNGPIDWGVLEANPEQVRRGRDYILPNNADAIFPQPGSCKILDNLFTISSDKIDKAKLRYFPINVVIAGVEFSALNSNSFAYTLLLHAGLDPSEYKKELDRKLPILTSIPGWGKNLL